MVIFEFEYGTNMDRVIIDMNNKLGAATAGMEEAVGTPILMQINPDMLPVMIASVDIDGKTAKDITPTVSDTIVPAFERLNGVASVEAMGLIEKQLKVSLNQQKIDALNDRILAAVDSKLAEAQDQLREGEAALEQARKAFEEESSAKDRAGARKGQESAAAGDRGAEQRSPNGGNHQNSADRAASEAAGSDRRSASERHGPRRLSDGHSPAGAGARPAHAGTGRRHSGRDRRNGGQPA